MVILRSVVESVAASLIAAEPMLTDLDARAGDGDLGASMARGAEAIRALPPSSYVAPSRLLLAMSGAIRRAIAPFRRTIWRRVAVSCHCMTGSVVGVISSADLQAAKSPA